ncbi:glycoside hydrolase family 16 protein [Guyanagaster necrorhizus]|uniref:Glycoside hydrolase family 16 protein n=1 Tax=Guyanagaster necrorhizus TaxID=856835 RepID=A0A9P8AR59_9AGAR|nr:glycoside hydrolase family 16 protein [Guyanagaster necrorhizus MCA 3950]KAG7445068.1 glycoside hydrolase family 16 protein [Guyanagaster necrorhizus MCA 3950]
MLFFTAVALVSSLVSPVFGASYQQTDSFVGSQFYSGFSHQTISDPTNGRVNYVDVSTSKSRNLTYASGDTFILRADDTTVLSASGPGRNSVRLMSNNQYNSNSVMVFNIRHMPQGCGTWPAVWTVGNNWPNGGEIDIIEGVNNQAYNQATLHTSSGCTMPSSSRAQTGISLVNDCNANDNGNSGCGVQIQNANSYGSGFNNNGGGWYALEWTGSFIKIWFWGRHDSNVPSEVSNGSGFVNTDSWGTPAAYFPGNSCPIASHFSAQNIIIDCGDWAGNVYASSGCPSSCVDFVNNNPSAFADAYFDFAWVKIYD